MEKATAAKRKAFKAWKAGKGTRASYDTAKRNARHAVHHARQEADKEVYDNTDPKSSEVYRLANQFRRENTDVVGDKPVKNDAGEMSMSEDSKQKAWLEHYQTGLEKLKNPNRSSIFSPQKRKLPNRFSVISVTVVCFHSVLFFSFKIQGASSLLAQRLTYQYCFNTCSININIGISIINSNFAPTVQTRHISSTFIFPISGSLSY